MYTPRRPGYLGHQTLIRLRQQACEQRDPRTLALVVSDQVLADLDRNVMQAASLTMHLDCVIRCISHAARRVVADNKPLFAVQQCHDQKRKTRIAIV